ncbi:MAG: NfeD family protein [Acidobacteria bacterium]|nr:NfeD family protein [Acidobacteriota bacterium]
MEWWIWLLLGLVLLGLEVMTPGGFYLLFFGCGAVAVGIVVAAGVSAEAWVQWLLFSGLSILALLLFRRPLLEKVRRSTPSGEVDSLVGQAAVAMDEIGGGAMGKVELRGTSWSARNAGTAAVGAGQRCKVEKVDGLTLWVRGE